MTETLTGKEALLAILEGTHWWTVLGSNLWICFKDGSFYRADKEDEWVADWHAYFFEKYWTRGEPVEGATEKKTKTITLCRWRRTKTHDGKPGTWCSWRDPSDMKARDSCGGFVTFETEYCEVEVPE